MKKFQLAALILIIFSSAAFGQTKKPESIYTSLSDKECQTIKQTDEGESYRGICKGVGGYKLELLEGDLRQTINIIAPNKKNYKLDLWTIVAGGFSAFGEKAEWRVTRSGQTITPIALIMRFNVSENPEDSSKTTSYLVVAKITKTSACVTDVVKPMANQNIKAQQLADVAGNKPCKTSE
ncbi:MAG: hypothetical protein ABJA66_11330 [Actinomycetota bacterium]